MRFFAKCFLSAPLSLIAVATFSAKAQETAAPAVRPKEQQKPEIGNVAARGEFC